MNVIVEITLDRCLIKKAKGIVLIKPVLFQFVDNTKVNTRNGMDVKETKRFLNEETTKQP